MPAALRSLILTAQAIGGQQAINIWNSTAPFFLSRRKFVYFEVGF
jgi:hypothetical protein